MERDLGDEYGWKQVSLFIDFPVISYKVSSISMVVLCNRGGLFYPDMVSGAWRRIPRRSQPDAVLLSDRNWGAVGCCRPLCCHLCYIRSEFHIVLHLGIFTMS